MKIHRRGLEKGLCFFVEFVGFFQCGSFCDHVVDVHVV